MDKIDFFNTFIDPLAMENISQTVNSTFISEGKIVKKFEESLESYLKINNLLAVNSGTSALHLALILAEVGEGDEVIIPAQTFIATGLAVLMQKATPVFADCKYLDGNIDPKNIEKLITNKTKAIIPVHWGGRPCDMDEILHIANENNLKVIEDAAHAIGAYYKGKPIGSISDFTCFSFQAIKHLTTGDGGAISCSNQEKYLEGKRRRWFGLDRLNSKISFLGERDCDITELGYKYHLNDYAASLGLANLKSLSSRIKKRDHIVKEYDDAILNNPKLTPLLRSDENRVSSHWLYGIHVKEREHFIKYMQEKNIPVSVVHQGIDRYSLFKEYRKDLPTQREFDKTQIHLPIHDSISHEQKDHIIKAIKEF